MLSVIIEHTIRKLWPLHCAILLAGASGCEIEPQSENPKPADFYHYTDDGIVMQEWWSDGKITSVPVQIDKP